MLYDILMIDTDFVPAKDDEESKPWDKCGIKLFLELTRSNFRVTWSTGEYKDIRKLHYEDLSCIKFIILDMEFKGVETHDDHREASERIATIIKQLDSKIKSKSVQIFINNSKYRYNGNVGLAYLRSSLADVTKNKYKLIQTANKKNKLKPSQMEAMGRASIRQLSRSIISSMAYQVENAIDSKLKIPGISQGGICLDAKINMLAREYNCNKEGLRNKLIKLVAIRNQCIYGTELDQYRSIHGLSKCVEQIDILLERIHEAKAL